MSDREMKPRVWTLRQTFEPGVGWLVEGEMPEPGDEVRVIELEPVLDLLESWIACSGPGNARRTLRAEVILRAHGRLDAT